MTPAGDAAGTAPGPRLDESSACGGEAGPRSALPETREVPRPPVDPGPMPPRWRRSAGWYLHDTFAAAVGLEPDMAICIAVSAAGADMDRVESDLRDAADLVAWLRRGGR